MNIEPVKSPDEELTIEERQILYCLGELNPEEMADLDRAAIDDADLDRSFDEINGLIARLEQSPELELFTRRLSKPTERQRQAPSPKLDFWEFLKWLNWPWRTGLEWLRNVLTRPFRSHVGQGRSEPELFIPECSREKRAKTIEELHGILEELHGKQTDINYSCNYYVGMPREPEECYCFCMRMMDPPDIASLHAAPELRLPNDPDGFTDHGANEFHTVKDNPFSTFGIDVDTASYTIGMEYLKSYGRLPPPESVRTEEYINYFNWNLPEPEPKPDLSTVSPLSAGSDQGADCPFSVSVDIGRNPIHPDLLMAKIGLQGRSVLPEQKETMPPINLIFLIDVSGSMSDWNKLPLIKDSLTELTDQLRPTDHISLVTYANEAEVALEPTAVGDRNQIEKAILKLNASGGTFGSGGIELAYKTAKKKFNPDGINRIILCTDGDFNVGKISGIELEELIKREARSGVFLTVLGFGMGNYKDNRMETLANCGQGAYHYVNDRNEAKRLFKDSFYGTLMTIAKDVKIQLDFNPATITGYRLIGYENRVMADEQFNNDQKESGNIGAGHSVIALYELVPKGKEIPVNVASIDRSRYAPVDPKPDPKSEPIPVNTDLASETDSVHADELFLVKLRWKEPNEEKSRYRDIPVSNPDSRELNRTSATPDFRFACAVAMCAEVFKTGPDSGSTTLKQALKIAGAQKDPERKDFLSLIRKADKIK